MQNDPEKIVESFEQTLDEVVGKIDRVHGPLWEARNDVIRNIVAVGSAIFAGTITFSESILTGKSDIEIWFVLLSWTLMLLSIAAGVFVLWQSLTLRSLYPKLFNQSKELGKLIAKLDFQSPNIREQFQGIATQVIDPPFKTIGTSDRVAHWSSQVCLVFFFVSLLFFLIFAILRFVR
jgi:hypothetical protein